MIDYKDVVVDNDAIVNTEPAELPAEPYNIPQGEKPHLNPNPGYGEDGQTKPAIKTDLVEGERGTPVDVVTPAQEGVKVVREPTNFVGGLLVDGKKLEDYIDAKGGVTQEELEQAVGAIPNVENAQAGKPESLLGLNSSGKLVKRTPTSGTIQDALGLNSSGELVKGSVGAGGTQLYKHSILISSNVIRIINTNPISFGVDVSLMTMFMSGLLNDEYVSCVVRTGSSQYLSFPDSDFTFKYLKSNGTIGTLTTENNVSDVVTAL